MKSIRSIICFFLLTTILAGCGNLPRPFESDQQLQNPLIEFKYRNDLTVAPFHGLPPSVSDKSQTFLIEKFDKDQIFVEKSLKNKTNYGYSLRPIFEQEVQDHDLITISLRWNLLSPEGNVLETTISKFNLSKSYFLKNQFYYIKQLIRNDYKTILTWIKSHKLHKHKLRQEKKIVFLAALENIPASDQGLYKSLMKSYLQQHDYKITSDIKQAHYILNGSVQRTTESNSHELVEIIWVIYDENKTLISEVKQTKRLPSGQLDKLWNSVAIYIAQGSVLGIHQSIAKLH